MLVKEGWTDRDTGKKGEPRLQFVEVKQLQEMQQVMKAEGCKWIK